MTTHELLLVVEQALADRGMNHKEINEVLKMVSSGVQEILEADRLSRLSELPRVGGAK